MARNGPRPVPIPSCTARDRWRAGTVFADHSVCDGAGTDLISGGQCVARELARDPQLGAAQAAGVPASCLRWARFPALSHAATDPTRTAPKGREKALLAGASLPGGPSVADCPTGLLTPPQSGTPGNTPTCPGRL